MKPFRTSARHHPNRDEYKESVSDDLGAFPDTCFTIEGTIGKGDSVALRCSVRRSQWGALQGTSPGAKRAVAKDAVVVCIMGGPIKESWCVTRIVPLLGQVSPTPDRKGGLVQSETVRT